MEKEKDKNNICKNCVYFRAWYHSYDNIECECLWTLKNVGSSKHTCENFKKK